MNNTRNVIAGFLGDDTDAWTGRKIVLYPTQADFQGRLTDCIRVRPPKSPAAVPTAATPAPAPARPSKAADEVSTESDDVPF